MCVCVFDCNIHRLLGSELTERRARAKQRLACKELVRFKAKALRDVAHREPTSEITRADCGAGPLAGGTAVPPAILRAVRKRRQNSHMAKEESLRQQHLLLQHQ